MHPRPDHVSRDRHRAVAGSADLVVGGDRQLEQHMRTLVADTAEMTGMVPRRLLRAQPDINSDARRAQPCVPLPPTSGLGSSIADTTRAMPAAITASAQGGERPKCEHGSSVTYSVAPRAASPARRSASGSACGRPPACVQPRPTMTPSLTTTAPTAGLRPGAALPAPAERQRELHEPQIGGFRLLGLCGELVFQDAEDHLRNCAMRGSSSLVSSPSNASKSLASRKLR